MGKQRWGHREAVYFELRGSCVGKFADIAPAGLFGEVRALGLRPGNDGDVADRFRAGGHQPQHLLISKSREHHLTRWHDQPLLFVDKQ